VIKTKRRRRMRHAARRQKVRNAYTILVENLTERDHLEDLGTDWSTIHNRM
jgi:hypothetical protein